jgi:hypothetical protein
LQIELEVLRELKQELKLRPTIMILFFAIVAGRRFDRILEPLTKGK